MQIAVVGSRDFPDLGQVEDFIALLPADTTVVTSRCRGVDRTAWKAAEARGLGLILHDPDYKRYGPRAAPLVRNGPIARDGVDGMVAFWDGRSRGTQDAMRKARLYGRKVEIRYARILGN